MNNEFKNCITCKTDKMLSCFHKNPRMKLGRTNECKKCHHHRLQIARQDPEKKAKFVQYQRNCSIKKRYGITTLQFNEMVKQQDNKCLICQSVPIPNGPFQSARLHIDHCHRTSKIRGLLCHLCNRAIGLFRERTDILQKAIEYLKSHD